MYTFYRKIGIIALIMTVLIGFCMVSGCTGDSGSETPATPAATTVPPTQTSAGGPSAASAVHYTELYRFFPTPTSNWIAGDPTGFTMSDAEGEWSFAQRQYTHKTNSEIVLDIVIQDTAGMNVGYFQAWDSYVEMDTPEMSWKQTTVRGYPAWEFYDKMENSYTQIIAVNDRFIVWIYLENGQQSYLTVFNTGMDFDGLAALA
ncbi:MAG: hypothetical protein APR53_03720 [Methanoculleus sp. SDB]|nr:MAG: hypothetical protein APR53_03720 [Methanoculleus sp. SDB]